MFVPLRLPSALNACTERLVLLLLLLINARTVQHGMRDTYFHIDQTADGHRAAPPAPGPVASNTVTLSSSPPPESSRPSCPRQWGMNGTSLQSTLHRGMLSTEHQRDFSLYCTVPLAQIPLPCSIPRTASDLTRVPWQDCGNWLTAQHARYCRLINERGRIGLGNIGNSLL